MCIEEALRIGRYVLKNRSSGRIEIEILLMHLFGISREKLFIAPERVLSRRDEARFKKFLSLLKKDCPIAYITGEKEFYGEKFYVDKNVLIPRPETELLVDESTKIIKENFVGQRARIVDVGTGSGCVAISIAKNCPDISVVGVDVSRQALHIAEKNALKHKLGWRIKFVQSFLLNKISDQRIDILAANLPYIGTRKYNFIDENVQKYEPHKALYAGKNGLELYDKLFEQIAAMKRRPKFVLGEFGYRQGSELRWMLNKYFVRQSSAALRREPAAKFEIKKDYAGIERVFIIKLA